MFLLKINIAAWNRLKLIVWYASQSLTISIYYQSLIIEKNLAPRIIMWAKRKTKFSLKFHSCMCRQRKNICAIWLFYLEANNYRWLLGDFHPRTKRAARGWFKLVIIHIHIHVLISSNFNMYSIMIIMFLCLLLISCIWTICQMKNVS